MPRDAKGNRLHRHIEFKIILPKGEKPILLKIRANPHCGFNPTQIDEKLESVVEFIEKKWPFLEFRLVELGPAAFNFVCRGFKQAKIQEEQVAIALESFIPELETAEAATGE
jgi:hypothetical protein